MICLTMQSLEMQIVTFPLLIVWRRLAVSSCDAAIYIFYIYIVRQTIIQLIKASTTMNSNKLFLTTLTSAQCPSAVNICVAVISFLVSVPVLSEHITLAHPSVSTMGSFLTMAFLLAILITPSARVTVTTMGRPSGMAATAKLSKKNVNKILKNYYLLGFCLLMLFINSSSLKHKLWTFGTYHNFITKIMAKDQFFILYLTPMVNISRIALF